MRRLIVGVALLLTSCGAPEQRQACTTEIHNHPTLPRPAGVIVVVCDGIERARIVAKRVYAE